MQIFQCSRYLSYKLQLLWGVLRPLAGGCLVSRASCEPSCVGSGDIVTSGVEALCTAQAQVP